MSLVVEIQAVKPGDAEAGGLSEALRMLVRTLGTYMSNATFDAIDSTICRGILQNNIDISFTNKWDSTVYQGVMSGVSKLASTADTGTWGNWGKAIMASVDFLDTGLNMGGMSMVGTGAASTKMYGGSNISGLTISLKWYTPQNLKSSRTPSTPEYAESIKALMVLGFPSQRDASKKTPTTNIDASKLGGGKKEDDTSVTSQITKTIETLFSINPPPVKLTIKSGDTVIYSLHPLVITNISLNASRETYNGLPVVIGANVSFDFYQIKGNGGYTKEGEKLRFAGIDLLDKVVANENLKLVEEHTKDENGRTHDQIVSAKGVLRSWDVDPVSGSTKYNEFNPSVIGPDGKPTGMNQLTIEQYKDSQGSVITKTTFPKEDDPATTVIQTQTDITTSDGSRKVITNEIVQKNGKELKNRTIIYNRTGLSSYSKDIVLRDSKGEPTSRDNESISVTELPPLGTIPNKPK